MECEVCGRRIPGRAHRVIIDGAKLLVCSECTQFAPSHWRYEPEKPKISAKRLQPIARPIRARQPRQTLMSEDSILVEGYGKRIRKGREKLGLTHEELSRKIGEKISLLQKLETEKMIPDLALAKKLESALRIKLLIPPSKVQVGEEMLAQKPTDLTLGDVVVVQKREKS